MLYYGTNKTYLGVQFSSSQGVVPLRDPSVTGVPENVFVIKTRGKYNLFCIDVVELEISFLSLYVLQSLTCKYIMSD